MSPHTNSRLPGDPSSPAPAHQHSLPQRIKSIHATADAPGVLVRVVTTGSLIDIELQPAEAWTLMTQLMTAIGTVDATSI